MQGGVRASAYSTAPGTTFDLGILTPNIEVCNTDPSPAGAGAEVVCANPDERVATQVPAVVLSRGKNTDGNVAATSWIQRENLDNNQADRVFISVPFNDTAGGEFDDIVKWLSPNVLYSRMIEADQLP